VEGSIQCSLGVGDLGLFMQWWRNLRDMYPCFVPYFCFDQCR
jgi:hypothetical protein